MPPKSGKKKLSKAEKERLKKEEAERKLQEEEEARIAAEKEEEERKEQEKREAEERRRLENEERKKRKGQLQELEALWDSYRTTLVNEQIERRKNAKWARYTVCDGSPDPTIPGEINTFMNLWREQKERLDIESVLEDSNLPLGLIDELEFLLEDTPEEDLLESDKKQYKETIAALQSLLALKLDLASHELSLKASAFADSETMNLQKVLGNELVTLCMWGNLSKNPRIKQFDFEEQGFLFELPKLLTLSDIAIRILITKYDHLSQHCRTFHPRVKQPSVEVPEQPVEAEKPEGEGDEEGEKEAEGEGGEGDASREPTQDVMAALRSLEDGEADEEKPEGEEGQDQEAKEPEEPMEEDYEIKTPEPAEFEDFDGDEDILDLRAFHIIGGIYNFNLLHLPPQPIQRNEWIITQVLDPPQLQCMDYVADVVSAPTPAPADETKSEASESKKKDIEKPPIGVKIRLPEDVYFCEEPQVVRWDENTCEWKLDGFTDHSFDEEKRTLYFKTAYFGTLALAQDAHINMPFQSWELRPRGANHTIITIIAAIVEVYIEVKDNKVCLAGSSDSCTSELKSLMGEWMDVPDFIKCMRAAGVNVFPAEDSSKYVSIQNKNSVTEDRLYQQMALVSSSMAFSWSKWNSEIAQDDKIIFQGAEHIVDEQLEEEDWAMFMVTKKRTTKLKMTEFDEAFSEDHADGTEFHADLYHMVMDITGEEAKQRIRETNYKYIDALYQMLKATRLVTYS